LEDTIMAEDKQEWPVTDGAPLNPYDVDTSKMRDPKDDEDGADADAAMPKGDHVEDRDATRETTCTMVSEHARTGDEGRAWAS
jgi:hypothetical protein